MSTLLGSRIQRHDGVLGVIVHSRADSWRPSLARVYDIVWSDGASDTKISPEMISERGWSLQASKVDPAECSRIWWEFQTDRARQMAASHVGRTTEQLPRAVPIEVSHQRRSQQVAAPVPVASELQQEPQRPASWHARQLLGADFPAVHFAVSLERRKLTVGWIDGPAEPAVVKCLSPLISSGAVEKLAIRRGVQTHLVQAAIEHVIDRVWDRAGAAGREMDSLRLTPEDFLSNTMQSVLTPMSCSLGPVPYSGLIRCVIDRWDDLRKCFVDTDRTRYLIQERELLFPGGETMESQHFAERVRLVKERAVEAVEQVGAVSDRVRG